MTNELKWEFDSVIDTESCVTFTGSAPGSATIQFEKGVGGLVDPSLDETGVDDRGPSSLSASESVLESLLKSLLESRVIVSTRMTVSTSYTASRQILFGGRKTVSRYFSLQASFNSSSEYS